MISRKDISHKDFPLRSPKYNPMPEPQFAGFSKTPDGVNIRYGVWGSTTDQTKGTILFLQGRTEYIEKGYETIRYLQNHGFAVLSFDWRGQGGSDRMLEDKRKGYVDEFDEYVVDLETIISDVALPDCKAPFYILGHSTGSLVALMAAPRFPNKIRRMVLCSTFLGITGQRFSHSAIKLLMGTLSALGLGDMYVSGGSTPSENKFTENNIYTSDETRFRRNRQFVEEFRELSIGGPTANWVFAACKAIDQVTDLDFLQTITIPTLFLLAGNDRVVDNRATEEFAVRLRSGSSLTIDGGRHEMLHEADYFREQCLSAIQSFVPGSGKV